MPAFPDRPFQAIPAIRWNMPELFGFRIGRQSTIVGGKDKQRVVINSGLF